MHECSIEIVKLLFVLQILIRRQTSVQIRTQPDARGECGCLLLIHGSRLGGLSHVDLH